MVLVIALALVMFVRRRAPVRLVRRSAILARAAAAVYVLKFFVG
jgi:hypothetical protein